MTERKAPTGFIGNVKDRDAMDKGWQTPPEILEPPRAYWGGRIPHDACTTPANPTGADTFWTPEDDGLSQEWPERVWCNPPYGRSMKDWCAKAIQEASSGSEIIMLLSAARWEQHWWQAFLRATYMVCFIRGRVSFIRPATGERVGGNTYANMYAFLGVERPLDIAFRSIAECFGSTGLCVAMSCWSQPPAKTAYQQYRERMKVDGERTEESR